jgi:RNA exonuclease 4
VLTVLVNTAVETQAALERRCSTLDEQADARGCIMDDIVKAAVRAAMARESHLVSSEAGTSSAAEKRPAAFMSRISAAHPDEEKTRKSTASSSISKEARGSKRSVRRQRKSSELPEQKTVAPIPSPPGAAGPKGVAEQYPAMKEAAVTNEQPAASSQPRLGAKKVKLSSNWAALRATLRKATAGVTKRRPRKPICPASEPEKALTPPAPLTCSMFVKAPLRSGPAVKPTKVIALDCEFVGIGPEGREDALARASLVNSRGEILYDSFVSVEAPVVDYRTQYSGVRPRDLVGPGATDPRAARTAIAEILKGRILVGHAVHNDLRVLRIAHPKCDTRDTSDFYKKLWRRNGRRGGAPPALRLVVARVLGVDQFQNEEHDSCEDARAALALYKKNAKEWESSRGGGGNKVKSRK